MMCMRHEEMHARRRHGNAPRLKSVARDLLGNFGPSPASRGQSFPGPQSSPSLLPTQSVADDSDGTPTGEMDFPTLYQPLVLSRVILVNDYLILIIVLGSVMSPLAQSMS